jgi:hypothetical protein
MNTDFEETKKEVLANPVYSKGIITAKRTYKGKGADIEYYVEGKKYELKTGITTEFYKHYKIGDTVDIVYLKSNPNLVILSYDLKPH